MGGKLTQRRKGAKIFSALFIFVATLFWLTACVAQQPPAVTVTPTAPPPEPTATLPEPQVVITRPGATATPGSVLTAGPTEAGPAPTPGPLNEPVEAVPKGGESCEDYPCPEDAAGWEARLRVPPGFRAEYFALLADELPTSMAFGPDGLLYVTTYGGNIFTIDDEGQPELFVEGLLVPVGLAFEPESGRLFVSSRAGEGEAQILVIADGRIEQFLGGIPCCYAGLHAANGLAFGPDGDLYVAVGARADHGEVLDTDIQDELHPWEASILRLDPASGEVSVYARGFRNAFDIAWDGSGRLFASDNAPDYGPPEEFHLVEPGGQHGYPWYMCDHCFAPPPDVEVIPPLHELLPHSAPTGLTAYLAEQFPGYYNNLFLTLWSAFPGAQKVVRFGPGGEGMTDFATGFAAPIEVVVGPAGSLYVADYATGVIFKISYEGE